jgi:hypothetical protein
MSVLDTSSLQNVPDQWSESRDLLKQLIVLPPEQKPLFLDQVAQRLEWLSPDKKVVLRQKTLEAHSHHFVTQGWDITSDAYSRQQASLQALLDNALGPDRPLDHVDPWSTQQPTPLAPEVQELVDAVVPRLDNDVTVPFKREEPSSPVEEAIEEPVMPDFLAQEALWQREHYLPLRALRSAPSKRSSSGSTLCSMTAQQNWDKLWISLPKGNAKLAVSSAPVALEYFKSTLTKPSSTTLLSTLEEQYRLNGVNFFDVSVHSKSSYGHRAVLFRDLSSAQWYVLDPYRFNSAWYWPTSPKPAQEYFANPYNKPLLLKWYAAPVGVVSEQEHHSQLSSLVHSSPNHSKPQS